MNIIDARAAADASTSSSSTTTAFEKVVSDAIWVSIGSGLKTSTISISGKVGSDVMSVLQELRQKGYRVASSGTSWVVTW